MKTAYIHLKDHHDPIWNKAFKDHLVGSDDIDARAEGNPIATGCYTTRSTLKRQNRALEHHLLSHGAACRPGAGARIR